MTLTFNKAQGFTLPDTFYQTIMNEMNKAVINLNITTALTLNFRDEDYSAERGGYHPVEVRLEKHDNQWSFVYITDFTYSDGPFPDLVKEIDVCFERHCVFSLYSGWLNKCDSRELLSAFIDNFVSYYERDVYTVSITFN